MLISGASIAGPVLAYWLYKYGFEVKIVERAPELRMGGQNLDLRDAGRKVAEQMGIIDEILGKNTGELGVQFIDSDYKVSGAFPKSGDSGFTSELEIVRGDLVQILVDHTKEVVDYRFGDSIKALAEQGDHVLVTYDKGGQESFDLVIAADGVRSTTRSLIFGEEAKFNDLGLYNVYLTLEKTKDDTDWARWYNAPGSRVLFLRPDSEGAIRASLSFLSSDDSYLKAPREEQRKMIIDKLDGIGWEGSRLVDALSTGADFYFDKFMQVMAPRWSSGRMAMVGDAAYCPTAITGMGTSLAVIGAYVLAGELAKNDDYSQAFAAYEQKFRPFVTSVQKLPPGTPWVVHPKYKWGVAVLNTFISIAASGFVKKVMNLFKSNKKTVKKDDFELPDYHTYLVR